MLSFDINTTVALKSFLENCNFHDGFFRYAKYDQVLKQFSVCVDNTIWGGSVSMLFCEVQKLICISDYKWSKDETILGCCIIESDDKQILPYIDTNDQDNLCILFEMLSGNCIYIVCSELKAHRTRDGSLS